MKILSELFNGDYTPMYEDLAKIPGIYLGGSRFMAKKYPKIISVTAHTDHDFYIQDSPAIRQLLKELGGQEHTYATPPYCDDDCNAIYLFPIDGCQVVLRKNAYAYNKMFDTIDGEFYRDYLWKSGPNKPQREQIKAIINQLLRTKVSLLLFNVRV